MKNNRGLLVVLSGPSGSGKGTVLKQAMRSDPNIEVSVSVTTRAPREGEIDGVNYYFLTPEAFQTLLAEDGLLEWAEFCGNFYGTPREKIEQRLNEGKDVVLEIEVQGAMKVRAAFPDAVLIFNLPPSLEELKNRLTGRQTEPPEVVEKRLNTAVWELSQAENYDYVIVNDNVEDAANAFLSILSSEKCKTARNKALLAHF
ncbi:guanylate kinase [Congzhengia sp.]|uniref:guanylate kinase n=1 Tax=Congzhengia sp. TaxID=2944168 RepID=UPI003076F5E7